MAFFKADGIYRGVYRRILLVIFRRIQETNQGDVYCKYSTVSESLNCYWLTRLLKMQYIMAEGYMRYAVGSNEIALVTTQYWHPPHEASRIQLCDWMHVIFDYSATHSASRHGAVMPFLITRFY